MGTSLFVSLGWQECACGRAETDELTGKLFLSHLFISLIVPSLWIYDDKLQ